MSAENIMLRERPYIMQFLSCKRPKEGKRRLQVISCSHQTKGWGEVWGGSGLTGSV